MFFVMMHCMDNCFLLISGLPFAVAPGYDKRYLMVMIIKI